MASSCAGGCGVVLPGRVLVCSPLGRGVRRRARPGGRRRRLPDQPFRLAELLARIRAHLRRGAAGRRHQRACSPSGAALDLAARRVPAGDREVPLRAKEFDLLARLARRAWRGGQPRDR